MKRLMFIACLVLLFAACSPQAGDSNDEAVQEASQPQEEVALAPTDVPAEGEGDDVDEAETAVSVDPTNTPPEPEAEPEPEPTEAAPPEIVPTTPEEAAIIREGDQIKGAENGRVVIIEYGDFQ